MTDVRVFPSIDMLSDAVATHVAAIVIDAVGARGRSALALSGGRTPRRLFHVLSSQFAESVPWPAVHVFWGDERYVPPDDVRSNAGMARATLLNHVACPAHQIHPMPTSLSDADEAAREYDRVLEREFGGPPDFDLVLLGLGSDGHTASIFPGSPALTDTSHWTLAVTAPVDPPVRLTLTLRAILRARHIAVLAAGADKAAALRAVLDSHANAERYPAAAIARSRATVANVTWWVDEPAASLIPSGAAPGVQAER